jgi:DNA-binding NarL/FixJ family response regulator
MDYRYVVRILAVEDLCLRQEFAKELQEHPNLHMNAVAEKALEELQQNMPLQDIGLRKLNGIEGTTRADKVMVGKTILSVSQEFSPEIVRGAVRVDALGCVHKSHVRRKLLQRALWGTPLFSERSWRALTIALAISTGLLLVGLMQ